MEPQAKAAHCCPDGKTRHCVGNRPQQFAAPIQAQHGQPNQNRHHLADGSDTPAVDRLEKRTMTPPRNSGNITGRI